VRTKRVNRNCPQVTVELSSNHLGFELVPGQRDNMEFANGVSIVCTGSLGRPCMSLNSGQSRIRAIIRHTASRRGWNKVIPERHLSFIRSKMVKPMQRGMAAPQSTEASGFCRLSPFSGGWEVDKLIAAERGDYHVCHPGATLQTERFRNPTDSLRVFLFHRHTVQRRLFPDQLPKKTQRTILAGG
jgi:hypothetical protein